MCNRDRAIAARCKCQPGARIESIGVHTLADWHRRDDFSIRIIDHRHDLVTAAREQPFVSNIYRESGRFVARIDRPGVQNLEFPRVKLDNLVFVFDVDVDTAGTIRLRTFWFATERDTAHDLPGLSVDSGRIISTISVEGKDSLQLGSYRIPSGFLPGILTLPITCSFARPIIVTVCSSLSLVNARLNSGAKAIA